MMPSRSSLRIQIRKSRQEHDNKQDDDVGGVEEEDDEDEEAPPILEHFSICSSQETT